MVITERTLCPILVGRDEELTLLEDALLSTLRGDGQVVVLAGDAGVGKTRLSTEVADQARKLGATVLRGGCSEADLALPYLPFVEAFGNWLAETDLDRVIEQLGPSASELAQLFPQLGKARNDLGIDPSQAKLRLFEGVLSLVRVAAGDTGGLFIIEDLHWADAATRELIDYMTRRLRGVRIMVLATYRLDEMHRKHPLLSLVQGWRRSHLAYVIELEPLSPESIARMIAAIFGYEEVSKEFRDFFHDRTEGNPFVLEEMLKEALDRGDIYRTTTRWERKDIGELAVPRSVADSILLRVERLGPDQAEVLRIASVLGPSFSYALLLELADLPSTTVQSALQAAVLQQLLVEEGAGRYRFRHALTREAVYEDLIGPRRLEIHSRAADVLRERPETRTVDLAVHLLAAQRWHEAVPVCLQAAREAMSNRAFEEAGDLAERALAHIDDELERGRTLLLAGDAAFATADIPRAAGALERALDILERHGKVEEAAAAHLTLGRSLWIRSQPLDAQRHYEAAKDALEPLGPSSALALAYVRLAGLAQFDYRHEEGVSLARRAIEVAEAAGDDATRVWAYVFLGGGLTFADPAQAIAWMERAVEEAIPLGLAEVAANAVHNAAVTLAASGFLERSDSMVERFSEIAPHPFNTFSRIFVLGVNTLIRGHAAEALEGLESVERLATENEWGVWQGWVRQWITLTYSYLDRPKDADRFRRGLELQQERQEVSQTIFNALVCALARGDEGLSRDAADRALADPLHFKIGSIAVFAADALRRSGRISDLRVLTDAAQISEDIPDYGGALGARGMLAAAEGRLAEAIEHLRASIGRYEPYENVIFAWAVRQALGETLASAGRLDEARTEFEHVVRDAGRRGAPLAARIARERAAQHGLVLEVVEAAPSSPRLEVTADTTEKLVTVMFADVRGYTSMTRERAPAEMHERMSTFYRWARSEIEKHDGMVDRYAGDAVMASWNSTKATLMHTEKALETAIAIQDKAALMELPVGVGIAVGSALVGRMTGSDNVDVIGETTNLAARLQAQAGPSEVIVSREAFRRVKQYAEARGYRFEDRALTLKGYDEPVPVVVVTRR